MNQLQVVGLLTIESSLAQPKSRPKQFSTSLLFLSIICLINFHPILSIFSTKTHYPAGGDIILVDILPNRNILKVTENYIITLYDPGTYAQLSSLTLTLGADGSLIGDAALIDANNILIVTYKMMWHVNMQTGVETNVGTGHVSSKSSFPVKQYFFQLKPRSYEFKKMGPTAFAGTIWGDWQIIWMKDITQPTRLDTSVHGWPRTANTNNDGFLSVGGFDFSKVDPYPPKMYFGLENDLVYVNYPSNGARTVIMSGLNSDPVHLDVQNEGGQDVIYFCTKRGFYKYNFQTNATEILVIFEDYDWEIGWSGYISVCRYLHSVNRIILIVRDKVGIWGLVSGAWTPLFTPKKRFWYPYRVRVLELGSTGLFILHAKHAFMVLDSANLNAVHVWNREWDWGDWGSWNYVLHMGYGITKFDAQNPYPQTFKEVKDVFRIDSWNDNSNTPVIMVKDTGELGTYVFNSGTFTSLSTTSHFWDACFTTSNQKAVAVSWLPNAEKEFMRMPNTWPANDHSKDWYLWYLDWSSGSLVSNSWGWDPQNGGSKAIKFFVQNGNPYLLFATKSQVHISRYVENSQGYDPTQIVSRHMTDYTPYIWAVDKIQNSHVFICTSLNYFKAKNKLGQIQKSGGEGFGMQISNSLQEEMSLKKMIFLQVTPRTESNMDFYSLGTISQSENKSIQILAQRESNFMIKIQDRMGFVNGKSIIRIYAQMPPITLLHWI